MVRRRGAQPRDRRVGRRAPAVQPDDDELLARATEEGRIGRVEMRERPGDARHVGDAAVSERIASRPAGVVGRRQAGHDEHCRSRERRVEAIGEKSRHRVGLLPSDACGDLEARGGFACVREQQQGDDHPRRRDPTPTAHDGGRERCAESGARVLAHTSADSKCSGRPSSRCPRHRPPGVVAYAPTCVGCANRPRSATRRGSRWSSARVRKSRSVRR